MSVFAEPLAQARFILRLLGVREACDDLGLLERLDEALAALDLIEQRAKEMEKALREARDWIAEENEVLNAADADWRGRLLNRLDAVLSAREEAE